MVVYSVSSVERKNSFCVMNSVVRILPETLAGKEEILEDIRQGLEEVKLYREGKLELKTLEEALHEL